MVEGHPVECGKIETELFHLFVPAGNCGDEYRGNKFREKYWGETMGKTILTAKHITKLFPGMKALDDVDFDLQEGEVHILVGENGAGKELAKPVNASADLSVMNNFTDKGDISAFAVNAMASLIGGGHLYGGKDGKLMPKQLLTRAEGVVLLSRLMNASKNTSPEDGRRGCKAFKGVEL